jgi:hypothetical protein
MKVTHRFLVAVLVGVTGTVAVQAVPAKATRLSRAQRTFFEKNIRPVLVEKCYKCHSTEPDAKIKGGLAVDTREALMTGGDTGPAIVPGKPDASLLMETLHGSDPDLLMPPEKDGGKLSAEIIAAFAQWIKIGAPDPRSGKAVVVEEDYNPQAEKVKAHPFFKPVKSTVVPMVKNTTRVVTPVDSFVLARLEAAGMEPSPSADRRTLIRRVYFDLIGLPPTVKVVDVFLADKSPKAFEKVVDRLLKSKHYGERWGRYWLDVARYGDTTGTTIRNRDNRYHYAYTYRDYVIRSFNEDKPYDQFLVEQIAADRLELGKDQSALAALGFLTLGNRFNNDANQVIDDRIDVIGRGTMGLTITCGRCHDHKFDPITMKDYYALHGIFSSSEEPPEKPLLRTGNESSPDYQEYLAALGKREAELANARRTNALAITSRQHAMVGEYLLATYEYANPGAGKKLNRTSFFRARELDTTVVGVLERRLKAAVKKHDPILAPWVAFSAMPKKDVVKQGMTLAKRLAANSDANKKLNPLVAKLCQPAPKSMKELAGRYGKLFAGIGKQWQSRTEAARKAKKPAPSTLGDVHAEALRQVMYAERAPFNLDDRAIRRLTSQRTDARLNLLIRKVNDLKVTHPGAPPRAMVMVDRSKPRNSPIFLRGNPGSRGTIVKRQFLEILGGSDEKAFTDGSGRLELARAIASRDNPLTARVMVNRIWLHHFGQGIVTSPSDFGLVGEPPSHPGLLDWLAWKFMENKWSMKHLHRLILLSSTWQQSSDDNVAYAEKDQGNYLLWRQNRRRLDFESMRDTLMAVSGTLEKNMGGPPVDLATDPAPARRAVYGLIDRSKLPGFFNTFDFASPDISSPQRVMTTVPQQALYLMNAPFVVRQGQALAAREEVAKSERTADRIRALYRVLYQRLPSVSEMEMGQEFIKAQLDRAPAERETSAWSYGYGWFDPKTKKVRSFGRLSRYQYGRWEGSRSLGGAYLDARGGTTGVGPKQAVIRRWTAPRTDLVSIEGNLITRSKAGVRGRIVHNRSGGLGTFEVKGGKTLTDIKKLMVRKGDLIYFVVESLNPKSGAAFKWSPAVKLIDGAAAERAQERYEWLADADFEGPPPPPLKGLQPWEKYAQVLLLANETVFVN